MAQVMVPICALRYDEKAAYPLEAASVFHEYDLVDDDSYTFTMQVRVVHEPNREEIRQALRDRLPANEADRFIKFLDVNDWDVSFFVDGSTSEPPPYATTVPQGPTISPRRRSSSGQ